MQNKVHIQSITKLLKKGGRDSQRKSVKIGKGKIYREAAGEEEEERA